MIYSITAQLVLQNSLFIDTIISMNSDDIQPTAVDFAYTNKTLDLRIRLIPVQSDSSKSDSNKENIQPNVHRDAKDPNVPRTASASPYEQGEIIQGTGETRERNPDQKERTDEHHHTSQETLMEQDLRQYQRPPTPFRTTDERDHVIYGNAPRNCPFHTLYE